jgi:aspartyl/asparaginyl beta-hydroxylase (cupin superfamily)
VVKLMIFASNVSSAILPNTLSMKSVHNRIVLVVDNVDYEMTQHLRKVL